MYPGGNPRKMLRFFTQGIHPMNISSLDQGLRCAPGLRARSVLPVAPRWSAHVMDPLVGTKAW